MGIDDYWGLGGVTDGGKVVRVCDADWEFGRYDAAGGGDVADG